MVVHCPWNARTQSLGPNALPSAWNSPGLPGSHLYSSLTLNPAWYEGISSVIFLFSFHSHKWSACLPAQAAAEPGPGQFFWEAKPELCAFLLVRTQHGIPIWMYKELGKSFVYSLDRLCMHHLAVSGALHFQAVSPLHSSIWVSDSFMGVSYLSRGFIFPGDITYVDLRLEGLCSPSARDCSLPELQNIPCVCGHWTFPTTRPLFRTANRNPLKTSPLKTSI